MNALFVGVTLIFVISWGSYAQRNNVCPTFRDYFNMENNSRCWYNFAAEDKVVRDTCL